MNQSGQKSILEEIEGKIKQSDNVLIFGTRARAKILWCYLRDICHIDKVTGFVVLKNEENPSTLFDLPVFNLNQVEEKNTLILLAVTEKHFSNIKHELTEEGMDNVILFGRDILEEISRKYLDFLLRKNAVLVNKDEIWMKKMRSYNILPDNNDYLSLLSEMGDFIMPSIYGFNDLMQEGPYEFGKCNLAEGDYVIDCGADRGLFSCFALTKIGNDGQVFSFEPTPESYNILLKQEEIDKRIHPLSFAIDEMCGKRHFVISEKTNTENKICINDTVDKTLSVNAITIDAFVEKNNIQHIDFIKADIEGAERRMLKGAEHTLKTMEPKLAICTYHLPDDKEVLEKIIKDINPRYKVEHKWMKLFAWVDKS